MKIEIQNGSDRTIKLLQVSSWSLPQDIQNSCSHFVCFIVGDAIETPDEEIRSFMEQRF